MWIVDILLKTIFGGVVVNTSGGQLEGIREHSNFLFSPYLAFKGIPYAEPPIGELRFRAPMPHRGWKGVLDASKHGNICSTNGLFGVERFTAGGDEDCLFLNVYTTELSGSRPVLFFIHGNGFKSGSGNEFVYGPDYFVSQDIVVVTINYRLGAFGFLSTGDEHAPGNYALKDAALALKWVQKNIKEFGGDPCRVTIMGHSAGAVLAHHLILSDATRGGLFSSAILMSGNALTPFSFQPKPLEKAQSLAHKLGISSNSTKEMIQELRKLHFSDILKHDPLLIDENDPVGLVPFDFGLTVEPESATEERFVTESPEIRLNEGKFQKIPMMVGVTSNEGCLVMTKVKQKDSKYPEIFENHPEFFVPVMFDKISVNDTESVNVIADAFKKLYFDEKAISLETLTNFINFYSDASLHFSVDRSTKLTTMNTDQPVYFYSFSYTGSLNIVTKFYSFDPYRGACHGDDLFYLFYTGASFVALPYDHARTVRDRMVKMWSDFIKTGNPTPESNADTDVNWPRYTLENEEYLDIGSDLTTKKNFDHLKLWYLLLEKYSSNVI